MGFIPDRHPDTGRFSIESRRASVIVQGPQELLNAHDHGTTGSIEIGREDCDRIRACLLQAEWVEAGSHGLTFEGVPVSWELVWIAPGGNAGEQRLAQVATESQVKEMLALAERARLKGAGTLRVRPLVFNLAEPLERALRAEQAESERLRVAARERHLSLVIGSLTNGSAISIVVAEDGIVSAVLADQVVVAIDRSEPAVSFRLNGTGRSWFSVDDIELAVEGDGAAMADVLGDAEGLDLEELRRRAAAL